MSKATVQRKAQRSGRISKPAALKPSHDLGSFDCGRDQINNWLRTRAKKASESGTARTYVICRGPRRVIGFYSLAAGGVAHAGAPGALTRNTPDPIPVIILARFGVHKEEQGQGLGQDILNDAARRSLQAARIIGARALLVHALDPAAARFYEHHGFSRLIASGDTFFAAMSKLRDALS